MTYAEATDELATIKRFLEQAEPAHEAYHRGWARRIYALNLAIDALGNEVANRTREREATFRELGRP